MTRLSYRSVFAALAAKVTGVACFLCLLTIVKNALHFECLAPGGGNLRPVAIASMTAAALSLVSSAAYLSKSRACSWALASLQVAARALCDADSGKAHSDGDRHECSMYVYDDCSEYQDAIHAICCMWCFSILMTGLSAMRCE